MRSAEIRRKTAETDIQLALDLDGAGKSDVATGCGFLAIHPEKGWEKVLCFLKK